MQGNRFYLPNGVAVLKDSRIVVADGWAEKYILHIPESEQRPLLVSKILRISYISASVIPSLTANSIQVMKMCQAMVQEGHRPSLYAIRSRTDDIQDEEKIWRHYGIQERFPIHWLVAHPRLRGYDVALAALIAARRSNFDLIYTRHSAAAALSSLLGYPTIYEVHDMPSGRIGPWLFRMFLLGKGFVRLVAISDALRFAIWERHTRFLKGKEFIVAHDGVDLERFDALPPPEEARRRLKLPEAFTVGYAGSFYAGRGVEMMLDLAAEMDDVQFLMLGGDKQSVQTRAKQVAAQGLMNVYFLGFVSNSDLPLYLAACEVLLMPYERHVTVSSGGDTARYMSPLKLFEYMAAERLVISSDLSVLREVLNEQNSALCAPEDRASWRTAISRAQEDRTWRLTLARQARQDVEQYTWRQRVRRCLSVG